jgi:hypothetical protein
MDHLAPMSDWEGTMSDPLLVWRTRVDDRFLVEIQRRVPFSNEAVFCIFDKKDGMTCVRVLPVQHISPFKGGAPAREDVEDWAEKISVFLDSRDDDPHYRHMAYLTCDEWK